MLEALFGLFLLASNGFSITPSENLLKRSKRVVGGSLALIDQVPYMVNIRRDGVFQCGGSLLTPTCVLTAAHCVRAKKPKDFIIRAGVSYLRDGSNSRRVKQIFIPSMYDNKTLNYDIAIFKLQSPFTSPNVRTIELATEMPVVGQSVQVSGWGLTSETDIYPSNQLRIVDINVFPQSLCRKLYKNYRNVTPNMFCASIPGLKDACSADSGGPAVVNGKVVGIVSWGKSYECARVNSPGIYVNIPAVRHWIDYILHQAC